MFLNSGELSLNLAPRGQGPVFRQVFNIGAVGSETAVGPHLLVVLPVPLGEAPLLGDVDLRQRKKNILIWKKQTFGLLSSPGTDKYSYLGSFIRAHSHLHEQ